MENRTQSSFVIIGGPISDEAQKIVDQWSAAVDQTLAYFQRPDGDPRSTDAIVSVPLESAAGVLAPLIFHDPDRAELKKSLANAFAAALDRSLIRFAQDLEFGRSRKDRTPS